MKLIAVVPSMQKHLSVRRSAYSGSTADWEQLLALHRVFTSMTELEIHEYRDYDQFTADWKDDDVATQQVWHLLGELEDDELLVHLPEWLAEQKVGFIDGAVPTAFVGRITRDTDDAIRFGNAADASSLQKVAHRIHQLEEGIKNAGDDDSRREWLEDRLEDNRESFDQREDAVRLSEEWLPKSQIERAVRRRA